jgi:tRNA dimethylallyltransferase
LLDRIHRRSVAMLRDGAIEEVRAVKTWSRTSDKAIGVAEIQRLLRGEISEAECITAIETATRRYAKRQVTWFRRERWLSSMPAESSAMEIARATGLL